MKKLKENNVIELSKALEDDEITTLIEWNDPINLNDVNLPEFPIHCLPEPLKDYINAVAEATQTPCDMGAVACLTIMALCVQGKYNIKGKEDWVEPLNLFSAIVLGSGERKSQVFRLAKQYVEEYIRISCYSI